MAGFSRALNQTLGTTSAAEDSPTLNWPKKDPNRPKRKSIFQRFLEKARAKTAAPAPAIELASTNPPDASRSESENALAAQLAGGRRKRRARAGSAGARPNTGSASQRAIRSSSTPRTLLGY